MAELIRINHDDGGHHYAVDGVRILSVSEVLEISGVSNYSGIPEDNLRRAANRGIAIHMACDDIDKGRADWWSDDEEIRPRVNAYAEWVKDTGFEVLHSEYSVWNEELQFAGTPDKIGAIKGEIVIVDIKATSKVYPWTALQLAAYEICYPCRRRLVVWLKPNGRYKEIEYQDCVDYPTFLAALQLARWKVKHGLWRAI